MNIFVLLILVAQLPATEVATSVSPLDVVTERNRALNAHDLDAFLATYDEDVEVYVFPSKKLGSGKQHIRKIFSFFIESKSVSTKVRRTMESDGYVVVESVTTFGKKREAGIAIYEIRQQKIQSVRFIRDSLRAKQTDTEEDS